MFPTPPFAYFAKSARDPRCKPHLAAIAYELFGTLIRNGDGTRARTARTLTANAQARGPVGGAIFTRFMIAGFATYRALERLGVAAFESYPDLQFRLSKPSAVLAPKRRRAEAIAARRPIVARIAADLGVEMPRGPMSLDQLDAAILALAAGNSVRRGALAVAENPHEGRFMFALDGGQARRLGLNRA